MVGRGKVRGFSCAVVVGGLAVCLVLPEPLANRGGAIRPALRGQEAVEALKKQGAYESLAKAFEAARYQVESAGQVGRYRAANRAQGLEVEFAPEGVRLKHRDGALEMRLVGYGYGERLEKAAAPAVVGMTPQRGTGAGPATFTFQFSDSDGWQDLGLVNILVNDWLDGRNACYIAYSLTYGVLYLVNDTGTALSPELDLGSGGSVSNSQSVHDLRQRLVSVWQRQRTYPDA